MMIFLGSLTTNSNSSREDNAVILKPLLFDIVGEGPLAGGEGANGKGKRNKKCRQQTTNNATTVNAYYSTLRLRGGLTGVTRAPLQSHDLVLNVRIAIFEYICLLKSGDFGIFRKLENFEWEEIKNFHS